VDGPSIVKPIGRCCTVSVAAAPLLLAPPLAEVTGLLVFV